ncbi:MAG: L,D-transpeptidase [Akkermansiaceae bacterium]|jgi:lipoprotein-anchoring transpeptidase ErfK/SrfK
MRIFRSIALAVLACSPVLIISCSHPIDTDNALVVSVRDQKMLLIRDGKPVKAYPVSTSMFGLGSQRGSYRTPLGTHVIAKKIGGGAPVGAVFQSRRRTGAIVPPNSPGRDPIVTRILWLSGLDSHNRNTFGRCVYIHGTPAEYKIGRPASYGCIRMTSKDVIDLYGRVGVGAEVKIIRSSLDTFSAGRSYYARHGGRDRATATRW